MFLSKTYSILLVTIIVVATIGGVITYILLNQQEQTSQTIKIGILADLDAAVGRNAWQAAILAAEQINEEGGILGRQVEVIGEDHDFESGQDMVKVNSALTRLITYHNADFIIGQVDGEAAFVSQEIVAEHKIILLGSGNWDELTQRVLDDYDNYKYYFRVGAFNLTWNKGIRDGLENVISEVHGFDLVYKGTFPVGTIDFSSYLAAAEAAGTEVLLPLIIVNGGIPLAKEWHDRQSPIFIYGGIIFGVNVPESWEWTEGKCEYIICATPPVTAGYPLTSKTLPTREAYIERWGETPNFFGGSTFDTLRYILPDAIERAGTTETDAVIKALEETSIETSMARNFVFTTSHDIMVGENPNNPDADFMIVLLFQWQNGKQVPVYPSKIMQEAGATYMFPPWPGPWDEP
jgi:branched-chain amino acid transport system substrate-binding protein